MKFGKNIFLAFRNIKEARSEEAAHTEQNDARLSDKKFTRTVATAFAVMIACIVFLCSTTWAWFVGSVASNDNTISTSKCLLEISVSDGTDLLADIENGVVLYSGVEYTVTISLPQGSASGYCIVEAEDGTQYCGYYIARDDAHDVKQFTLMVESTQRVKVISHWGIYAGEGNVVDGVMNIQ